MCQSTNHFPTLLSPWWARCVGAVCVAALLAPFTRVTTTYRPEIVTIVRRNNAAVGLIGRAVPGVLVHVEYRHSSFAVASVPYEGPLPLCKGTDTEWATLGYTFADATAQWHLDGFALLLHPAGVGYRDCAAGIATEFRVTLADDPIPPTDRITVDSFAVPRADRPEKWVHARVWGACSIRIQVADGPDLEGTAPDVGMTAVDVDEIEGCGVETFAAVGGENVPASIVEADSSALLGNQDPEFPLIITQLVATRPGMTAVYIAHTPRTTAPGAALNVDVDVDIEVAPIHVTVKPDLC